jgi:hypothetical protein
LSPAEEPNLMEAEFVGLAEPGKNNWWRYLLGVLIIFFFAIAGAIIACCLDEFLFAQIYIQEFDKPYQIMSRFAPLHLTFSTTLMANWGIFALRQQVNITQQTDLRQTLPDLVSPTVVPC